MITYQDAALKLFEHADFLVVDPGSIILASKILHELKKTSNIENGDQLCCLYISSTFSDTSVIHFKQFLEETEKLGISSKESVRILADILFNFSGAVCFKTPYSHLLDLLRKNNASQERIEKSTMFCLSCCLSDRLMSAKPEWIARNCFEMSSFRAFRDSIPTDNSNFISLLNSDMGQLARDDKIPIREIFERHLNFFYLIDTTMNEIREPKENLLIGKVLDPAVTIENEVKLSEGGYGTVFKVDVTTKSRKKIKCALKKQFDIDAHTKEVGVLASFRDATIVDLKYFMFKHEFVNKRGRQEDLFSGEILLELASSSLSSLIRSYSKFLDTEKAWGQVYINQSKLPSDTRMAYGTRRDFAKQICEGLMYMHENGVMHRDIKPDNILVFGDQVKLTDFGLSLIAVPEEKLASKKFCGVYTSIYRSPELDVQIMKYYKFDGDGMRYYSFEQDIWALGLMLLEMETGISPLLVHGFKNITIDVPAWITHNEAINSYKSYWAIWRLFGTFPKNSDYIDLGNSIRIKTGFWAGDNLGDIVMRCLDYDGSKRPTARQLYSVFSEVDAKPVPVPQVSVMQNYNPSADIEMVTA